MLVLLIFLMAFVYLRTGLQVKDKDFIPVMHHVTLDWDG